MKDFETCIKLFLSKHRKENPPSEDYDTYSFFAGARFGRAETIREVLTLLGEAPQMNNKRPTFLLELADWLQEKLK